MEISLGDHRGFEKIPENIHDKSRQIKLTLGLLNAHDIFRYENFSLHRVKTMVGLRVRIIFKKHHRESFWLKLGIRVLRHKNKGLTPNDSQVTKVGFKPIEMRKGGAQVQSSSGATVEHIDGCFDHLLLEERREFQAEV